MTRPTGKGMWGIPVDSNEAVQVLRCVVKPGGFIDTSDSYGPYISEEIIAEELCPTTG